MTFIGQVWHVAAKDLRAARWALGVYALLVVAATVDAAGWWSATGISSGFWMLLVMPVAIFSMAIVLQADAPLRSDAFWASRPLSPAAVLVAKLSLSLLIVCVGAAGQFIALVEFDLPIVEATKLAARSAGSVAIIVPLTLLFAAVCRDLKSFALAIVAFPVVLFATSMVEPIAVSRSIAAIVGAARIAAGVVTALVLLAWMYRRRDVRVWRRVAACAAALILLVAPPSLTSAELHDNNSAGGSGPGSGTVSSLGIPEQTLTANDLNVLVHTDLPSQAFNATLEVRRVTVYLRDSSFVADIQGGRESHLVSTGLPAMPGIRWVGRSRPRSGPTTVTVSLPASQRVLLGPAMDSVTIEGDLITSEATVAATVPLVKRTPIARRGRRFYIEDVAQDGRIAALDLRTASVLGDDRNTGMAFAARFALVNTTRREAIALHRQQGEGSGGGLVLPGAGLRVERSALSSDDPSRRPDHPSIDARWLSEAELIEIEWVPRGHHPVRITGSVLRHPPR